MSGLPVWAYFLGCEIAWIGPTSTQGTIAPSNHLATHSPGFWTYCGWTKSCTTWKPWDTIVCWYLQENPHSRVSWVVRNGFRPSTVLWQTCLATGNQGPWGHEIMGALGFLCPKKRLWTTNQSLRWVCDLNGEPSVVDNESSRNLMSIKEFKLKGKRGYPLWGCFQGTPKG